MKPRLQMHTNIKAEYKYFKNWSNWKANPILAVSQVKVSVFQLPT